jgi:hypothetical protein
VYLISSNPTSQKPYSTETWTEAGPFELKKLKADIFLVGTVHLDPRLRELISELLNILSPSVLTVEMSRFSLDFRKKNEMPWLNKLHRFKKRLPIKDKNHSAIRLLERQLMVSREWTAASIYGEKNNIPVLPVDSSALARKELPTWEDSLIDIKNMKKLAGEPEFDLSSYFMDCYRQAEATLAGHKGHPDPIHPMRWLKDGFWQKRERMLAARIRGVHRVKRPVVHIGGWMHLIHGSPWDTISDHLADLRPVRLFIKNSYYFCKTSHKK